MAITSRTAAARAQPQQSLPDDDVFFNFMDFTFAEEGEENRPVMDIHDAVGGSPTFQFNEFPSPIPLNEINFNDQPIPIHPALKKEQQPTSKAKQTNVKKLGPAPGTTISPASYNSGPRTTARPKPEDVLSVRGVGHSKNPGNLKFRELVLSKKSAYEKNANPEFRRSLAVYIVAQLQPGRFLKKVDTTQRVYQIMDYEAAVTKALFAVRDVKPSSVSKRKAVKSNLVKGKRKRKPPAKSQTVKVEPTLERRPKRKKSVIKSAKIQLSSSILSESELEEAEKLISRSTSQNDVSMGFTRTSQIYARIEALVCKGAQARKSGADSKSLHEEWFEPERQKEIKRTLLDRCAAAMKTGMSFCEFFNKFDESLFPGADEKKEVTTLSI